MSKKKEDYTEILDVEKELDSLIEIAKEFQSEFGYPKIAKYVKEFEEQLRELKAAYFDTYQKTMPKE